MNNISIWKWLLEGFKGHSNKFLAHSGAIGHTLWQDFPMVSFLRGLVICRGQRESEFFPYLLDEAG
jgi:hypothetical protein